MSLMDNLRKGLFDRIYSGEIDRLGDVYDLLMEGYRRGPAVLSPETLIANLQEIDSRMLDFIIRQRGYKPVIGSGLGSFYEFTEADRIRAVQDSRQMFYYNPQVQRGVQSWTDFGFGQTFSVELTDEKSQAVWDEFIGARRNSPLLKMRKIQKLSNTLLVDGEIFFVFYISSVSGKVTIRRFKTDTVSQIIYADKDEDIPLFYVRTEDGHEVYYRDWQAPSSLIDNYKFPSGVVRAEQRSGHMDYTLGSSGVKPFRNETENLTDVVVLHAAVFEINGRGFPMFSAGFPWARAYEGFLRDRATVAKAVAATVDEIIHKTGSRGQADLVNKISSRLSKDMLLDSNPTQVAGSSMVHNDALTVNRRPLVTGASDAQTDGLTILGQVSATDYLPSHWRGRPDAMQNRATAREQERPWLEAMQRYQTFWTDVIGDIVEVVVSASERTVGTATTTATEGQFHDKSIFFQSPFVIYPDDAADAINAIKNAVAGGVLDLQIGNKSVEILVGLVLTTYGVSNVSKIFESVETEGTEGTEGEVPQGAEEQPEEQAPEEQTQGEGEGTVQEVERSAIREVSRAAFSDWRDGKVSNEQVVEYLYSTLMDMVDEQ